MVVALLAFSLLSVSAFGEVRLAQLLTEHMVLQRKAPVHIWGFGTPGEAVTATFRGESRNATTDDSGRWSVWFSPIPNAGGPFELVVKGPSKTIRFTDVLSGDVWIAAGQSNMEWPVGWAANPEQEKQAAKYPEIRLVRTMHRVREFPVDDFVGTAWEPCTPASVEHFSAVGYHFGRLLHARLRIPIGVIQTAWGGTPAEAWTSLRGIAADASLMPIFQEWARVEEQHQTELYRHRYQLDDWAREAAKARDAHRDPPEKPEMRTGPGGPWTPSGLFNGMVAPLAAFPIKGVIWYQGESNTSPERGPLYDRLFPALIQDWRRAWQLGDFPFFFVQLANFNAAPDSMWPEVREAQRHALMLKNTAMAVSIDAGTPGDIHPRNKRIIARSIITGREGACLRRGKTGIFRSPVSKSGGGRHADSGAVRPCSWTDAPIARGL